MNKDTSILLLNLTSIYRSAVTGDWCSDANRSTVLSWCSETGERCHDSRRRDWELEILRARRNQTGGQTRNVNTLCLVAVGCRDDLDAILEPRIPTTSSQTCLNNLITRKLQFGNVGGAASHQISVKYAENALMCYNQEVVLFTLELKNDRFKSDSKVMV